jgi:integrase/recombinase XerD
VIPADSQSAVGRHARPAAASDEGLTAGSVDQLVDDGNPVDPGTGSIAVTTMDTNIAVDVTVDLVAVGLADLLPPDAAREAYGLRRLTAAWLGSRRSPRTREAYAHNLAHWLTWCADRRLDPLQARRSDVDGYGWHLANTPQYQGRPLAESSVAQRLGSLSSWYGYLLDNDATPANPVARAQRPKLDRSSTTVALTAIEIRRLRLATIFDDQVDKVTWLRNHAMVEILTVLGIRVAELIGADVADLGHDRGHRVLAIRGEGGGGRQRPLPPRVATALDRYLEARADAAGITVAELAGPLLATATGRRLDRWAIKKLLRRLATMAGIPAAAVLTPHRIRHTWAATALDAGAAPRDVQDAMGHAHPLTTGRYDRSRHSLDRDPAYTVNAQLYESRSGR